MDKIYIKGLEVFANHGVFKEEKNLGQKFIIDIELKSDLSDAGRYDDLEKTIHYGLLSDAIIEEFTKQSYDLLEKATYELCKFILTNYNVKAVKILIRKPWAPVKRNLDCVAVEMKKEWHKVYLAVGSNMGDKEKNIKDAIDILSKNEEVKIKKISTLIETDPVGYLDQDKFLNGAIEIETIFSPKELMSELLRIEKELKRKRIIKDGPRTIDLDILLYDNLISDDEFVTLPHPRMEERLFVMEPLNEIAPNAIHPMLNKRISTIYKELEKSYVS